MRWNIIIRTAVLATAFFFTAVSWVLAQYGDSPLPGVMGVWTGGNVSNPATFTAPVVMTGDNASGTGTLRIRPSDEDTQLVICEASNNASPEVCSSWQHYNSSTTSSASFYATNLYVDSAGATQVYASAFGSGYFQTAGTTTAGVTYFGVRHPSAAANSANYVLECRSTGATTATCTWGSGHTVTNDFRGPITNGGSATCNGIFAGYNCINDGLSVYAAAGQISVQGTSASNYSVFSMVDSSGASRGNFGFYGASFSDADYADKVTMDVNGKTFAVVQALDVGATSVFREDRENGSATGSQLGGVYGDGADFKNGVTPTALSGDVNDYAGCTLSWCRISGGAANRNITGIASGADGKIFNVCNIGTTNTLVLVDESASSTAANRFALDANITIPVERCQRLVYDGTSSRWRAQQ